MKSCSKCNIIKELDQFYISKRDGLYSHCKECHSKSTKKWKDSNPEKVKILSEKWDKLNAGKRAKTTKAWIKANPDKVRNKALLSDYGITLEQYNTIFNNQNGLCKICNNPETAVDRRNNIVRKLAVDHCHKTGRIRGLLCSNCNRGLGYFKDNASYLKNASDYVSLENG